MIFSFLQKTNTFTTTVMSSHLLIKAKASKKLLEEASLIAFDIEKKLSAYDENSEICQINKYAGVKRILCSSLCLDILKISLEISEATKGVFDPSIGVLSQKAYGFGTNKEKLLTRQEKRSLQGLVDYKEIDINEEGVYLKKEGMALDLGGIGKGYAADKIISFLKSKNVKEGLVSVGGEIFTYGKDWVVGIQNPRVKTLFAHMKTRSEDTLVTSSGDYERFITNTSNHHILSPTKAQSVNLYSSLTLVSNTLDAGRMDALNTALFQMNEDEIIKLCKFYDMSAFVIDKNLGFKNINEVEKKVASFTLA